jgi:hypothetical protein
MNPLTQDQKMKKNFGFCLFLMFLASSAFAKIVLIEDKLFLRHQGKQLPLLMVNELISKKEISKVKLFGGGDIRLLSFAKKGESEKLYSVDEKGFVYAIEPFTTYEVTQVDEKGMIHFKQKPGKRFRIDPNGFFLH